MSLNICRRSFSTIKKCLAALNAQSLLQRYPAVTRTLLPDVRLILSAGYSNNHIGRAKLRLRKQNLPPYPHIECITDLIVENYLPSSYKKVKHGEYEFQELNGYVCLWINGYQHSRQINAKAGFAVYFDENHPLNLDGVVEGRQTLTHSIMYAFQKGMEQIPTDSFTKLCIMMPHIGVMTFIESDLRDMSENSFRSVQNGKMNKDLETSMEINKLLRTRQDLILRMIFCPNNIDVDVMYKTKLMAIKASKKHAQQCSIKRLED